MGRKKARGNAKDSSVRKQNELSAGDFADCADCNYGSACDASNIIKEEMGDVF